jgi:DNA-binding MarR family transcriptional regulator
MKNDALAQKRIEKAKTASNSALSPRPQGTSHIELIGMQWQREMPDLDLFEFLLAIGLMRLGTLVERQFSAMCEKLHGVSGSDMRVLLALRRSGHPYVKRPTDLFRALLVTSGAMTKKVDRLTALGFVERLPDPGNQGGFLVRLTRKGVKAAETIAELVTHESAIAPAMAQFTKEEREAGKHFCVRLLAAMEMAETEFEPKNGGTKRSTSPDRGSK